ncbi:MAG: MarR family winged helix-turn-helix transcriptional regulator [Rhizobiaceae bacterium]
MPEIVLEIVPLAKDGSLTGKLLVTARHCRSLRANLLLELGLYSGQDTLLKSLGDQDGQTMGELASNLGVRPPTVTKMVTRMAAQGFIERVPSKLDSRQFNVFLTPLGSQAIEQIDENWSAAEETLLASLKEKDLKRLNKILRKILKQFDSGKTGKKAKAKTKRAKDVSTPASQS